MFANEPRSGLASVVELMARAGIQALPTSGSGLGLRPPGSTVTRHASVKVRGAPPGPAAVSKDRVGLVSGGQTLLYIVPRVNATLRRLSRDWSDVDVVGTRDGVVIVAGVETRVVDLDGPSGRPVRGRVPWGRLALMRVLVRTTEPRAQTELAHECGITQAGVSLGLQALGELVQRMPSGWIAVDRSSLWDAFLAQYPGPGGITTSWYGLQSPVEQADAAVAAASGDQPLVSGDVAADRLAPWRRPRIAHVYLGSGLDLEPAGFAPAGQADATLLVTVPLDPTIAATAAAWSGVGLVDPLLAAFDVLRSGGPDAPDAVARLRFLVLSAT